MPVKQMGLFQRAAKVAYKAADEKRFPYSYTCLFLAMTHARLGHPDEARQWLEKAGRQLEQQQGRTVHPPWTDRLTLQLLRREADELLSKH